MSGAAAWAAPFEVPATTYGEAMATLKGALRFGICPMLETVEDMLVELGDPDLAFRSVQVAGTNGKTSTSRYAAAALAGEGLCVALYTSPELVSYTERMEVCGSPVGEAAFARGVALAAEAGRRVNARRAAAGERPYDVTEFDLLTVAAMTVFAEAGVDVAVLECGLGGRWDATSAARSIEAVAVTGVGLDHTHVLGDTLEAIAAEKAAVIRAGRSCVLGAGTSVPASVEDVFLDRCAAQGVTPTLVRPLGPSDAPGVLDEAAPLDRPGLPLATWEVTHRPRRIGDTLIARVGTPRATYGTLGALKPAYQAANIACAVALAEAFLGRALDAGRLESSVVTCPTPGRFDVVRAAPLALVDACHNPQSVRAFLAAVRAVEPDPSRRPALLVAVLADKDVDGICSLLAHEFPRVFATATDSPRAVAPDALAAALARTGHAPERTFASVGEALAVLADEPFVACGSITLAGAVAGALR